MNKKSKRWISIITLVVVMGAVAYYFHRSGDEGSSQAVAEALDNVMTVVTPVLLLF